MYSYFFPIYRDSFIENTESVFNSKLLFARKNSGLLTTWNPTQIPHSKNISERKKNLWNSIYQYCITILIHVLFGAVIPRRKTINFIPPNYLQFFFITRLIPPLPWWLHLFTRQFQDILEMYCNKMKEVFVGCHGKPL